MSKKCSICGKGPMVALTVARKGQKIKRGKKMIHRYVTGKSKRRQLPNLHKVKLNIDGTIKRVRVCTSCLSSSKVQKIV